MTGNTRKNPLKTPGTDRRRAGARHLTLLACLLLFLSTVGGAGRAEAADTVKTPGAPASGTQDSTRLLIPIPFVSKLGLETGFVNTRNMDTGVDFGALLGKELYHDFLEITVTTHLWGATNDTLDVATAAADVSFLYKIPIRRRLLGYAGFILGYGYVYSEKTLVVNGETIRKRDADHDFQRFITAGAEFDIHGNRTLFLQLKYGTTNLSREVHLVGGINFYTKYKKFIPWLAPPLIRD